MRRVDIETIVEDTTAISKKEAEEIGEQAAAFYREVFEKSRIEDRKHEEIRIVYMTKKRAKEDIIERMREGGAYIRETERWTREEIEKDIIAEKSITQGYWPQLKQKIIEQYKRQIQDKGVTAVALRGERPRIYILNTLEEIPKKERREVLKNIIQHEMGHIYGLNHEKNMQNIMCIEAGEGVRTPKGKIRLIEKRGEDLTLEQIKTMREYLLTGKGQIINEN